MSMRISSLLSVLLLAGCGNADESPLEVAESGPEMVACALAGDARFRRECMVEREGATIVLRHRDGGFRRLELGEGENRIRPADGFENALWREIGGGEVEVTMGRDRYRLALPAENRAATPQ